MPVPPEFCSQKVQISAKNSLIAAANGELDVALSTRFTK